MRSKIPSKITQLLLSNNHEEKEHGFHSFLERTHWKIGYTAEDLKKFACNQLGLKPNHVIVSKIKTVQPKMLWASQNGLESDKLTMVQAAYSVFKEREEELPPIIVWNFFNENQMRRVVHDGHHRTYFSDRLGIKLRVVELEPLGNYEIVEKKFRYAFQIRKRVIDLPVQKGGFF